jgi:hypothetical protein
MSEYVVPSAQVFEEFDATPVFTEQPMAPLILGPNYNLVRYGVADEKPQALVLENGSPSTNLNKYVGGQRVYNFQNVPANSVTDASYLDVYFDNALITFYQPASPSAVTVDGTYKNKISSSSLVFQTGGRNNTPFTPGAVTAGFGNRGVLAGDTVILQDGGTNTRTTKINAVTYSMTTATTNPSPSRAAGTTAAITCSASGTYTGTRTITYRLICSQGGSWTSSSTNATWIILSDDVESYGPFQPFKGGTITLQGLTLTVGETSTSLGPVTGDEFRIACTPALIDKYNVLVLADNVPTAGDDGGGSWAAFNIKAIQLPAKDLLIPRVNAFQAGLTNWDPNTTTDPSAVTVNASVNVIVPAVSAVAGLAIAYAEVYVERRDLLLTYTNSLNTISDINTVEAVLGKNHPDNALARGVYNALLNSNSNKVYYVAVASDDVTGYTRALELSKKNSNPYGVVPLTFNSDVQTLIRAHVNATSDPKVAKWRACWLSYQMDDVGVLLNNQRGYVTVTPTGGAATIIIGNGTPSTTSTALSTLAVGDILRYNFRTDPAGSVIYNTATVTAVLTNNSFTVDALSSSVNIVANVSFRIDVVRNYNSAQKAAAYKAKIAGVTDFRVRKVFPDVYTSGSVTEQGYLLAAGLAGLRGGAVPHQSLTNIQVLGPTDLYRVTSEINEDDLNDLAAEGLWIVTQAAAGAPAYTRDALTADQSILTKSKESMVSNADNISYGLQKAFAPYVGVYNINAASLLKLRAAADNELSYRMTASYTETAGTQLNGYKIISVAQDATFKNKSRVRVSATIPAPMDYIDVPLEITV